MIMNPAGILEQVREYSLMLSWTRDGFRLGRLPSSAWSAWLAIYRGTETDQKNLPFIEITRSQIPSSTDHLLQIVILRLTVHKLCN